MKRRRSGKAALIAALCLFVAGSLLAGCASTAQAAPAGKGPQGAKASWTVLIYLCGADLESKGAAATYNLKEIAATAPKAGVNVIIETGGAKEWHAKDEVGIDIPTDKLARWRFNGESGKFELIEEAPLASMANPDTLSDFIRWGAKTAPAQKYALVMWDHGGGSNSGLIWDELHEHYALSLEDFGRAIGNSGSRMEAVILDTCLMATIETAEALSPYVKYLIASEEVVPGYGSAYTAWLQYLYDHPGCSGADLGKELCPASLQKYSDIGDTASFSTTTFSCIDLSKIPAVSKAFDNMFAEIGGFLDKPDSYVKYAANVALAQRYYYPIIVDLEDFALKAEQGGLKKQTADAIKNAVDAAVVISSQGKGRKGSHGLAFYYDLGCEPSKLDRFSRACKSTSYLAFLDRIRTSWTAPAWVYRDIKRKADIDDASYRVDYEVSLPEKKNQVELKIKNGNNMLASIDESLYYYDKEHDNWLCLGTNPFIEADVKNATYYSGISGNWIGINGTLCYSGIAEESNSYNILSIPFQNPQDESTMILRGAYVFDKPMTAEDVATGVVSSSLPGHFEVYGVWDGDEAYEGAPSRNVQPLEDFYSLTVPLMFPNVQIADNTIKTDKMGWDSFGTTVFTRNTTISRVKLPAGQYKICFEITDYLGKSISTDPIDLEINADGSYKLSIPQPEEEAKK